MKISSVSSSNAKWSASEAGLGIQWAASVTAANTGVAAVAFGKAAADLSMAVAARRGHRFVAIFSHM